MGQHRGDTRNSSTTAVRETSIRLPQKARTTERDLRLRPVTKIDQITPDFGVLERERRWCLWCISHPRHLPRRHITRMTNGTRGRNGHRSITTVEKCPKRIEIHQNSYRSYVQSVVSGI